MPHTDMPCGINCIQVEDGLELYAVSDLDAKLEAQTAHEQQVYFGPVTDGLIKLKEGECWACSRVISLHTHSH